MSGFGWSLPPGCTNEMIERAAGGYDPEMPNCDECGADASMMEWDDTGCGCFVAVCRAQEPEIEDARPCGARYTVQECRGCAKADAAERRYEDSRE